MRERKNDFPTVGVLPGWHAYECAIDRYLEQLFRGIVSAAHEQSCNLLLGCTAFPPGIDDPSVPVDLAWPIPLPGHRFVPVGPWNTNGLIVVAPLRTGNELGEARSRFVQDLIAVGHPVVFVNGGEDGPTVAVDNEGGIRQAVAHLAEHGHRRIAFVAGLDQDPGDSSQRLDAYRSAVPEHGLESDDRLVAYGGHTRAGGRQAVRQLLEMGVSFTALVASNDRSAVGAVEALEEAGWSVPGDVAVIGFDDLLEARAQVPPLTTVHHPIHETGTRAIAMALERIEGKATDAGVITLPTRLVIRRSCGCRRNSELPGGHENPGADNSLADPNIDTSPVAEAMAEAVLARARHPAVEQVRAHCRHLEEVFTSSLERGESGPFLQALDEVLEHGDETGGDLCAWQAAITTLEDETPTRPQERQQRKEMLRHARITIGEILQERQARDVTRLIRVADNLAHVDAQLLKNRNRTQMADTVRRLAPHVGVLSAEAIFYEAEGDDPVARSVLWVGGSKETIRYPTREFPPPELVPADTPFSLLTLPLVVNGDTVGFVAFDTGNLEPCGSIAWQLASALRNAGLYREAVQGRRLAEEANRLKSRFLTMVGHELRTPLSLLVVLSEILLRDHETGDLVLPDPSREDLERMHASALHLDELISDVLDLARSDVGQLRLACEPLELSEVLRPVAAAGERMAREKGLAWECEIPGDVPEVWGDRTRLRQVALNLINNAIKFTSEGRVGMRVTATHGAVTVSVIDTGPGIPADEQDAIFDEFHQSARTTAQGYGGLGIGLAICRRLVEMHGGEIRARSCGKEGAGATFTFELPVMGEQPRPSPRDQTVLLVTAETEEGGARASLEQHLVQQGFDVEVEEYAAGETARWLSRIQAAPPGAVVLDTWLASEDGWEALRTLKENPATADVPILFYSLEQEGGTVLEMDYLTKPVRMAELAQALIRHRLRLDAQQTRTVLVVDDEPRALELHARIVQAQLPHCRALKARNGREALGMMQQERPDLVLLDLMMPEVDGFEVLEAMQAMETTRDVPVIVLTGQELTEDDMKRLNRGVAAVLAKGLFSVEETLELIETALTRQRRVQSSTQAVVRQAMAYIHENYADPISRDALAAHVGVSLRHLTRCFDKELGVSPIAYLNRCRVNHAKALLEGGDRSITDIAHEVGFSSSSYFAQVFRREVGISPSAWTGNDQDRPANEPG